MEKKSLLIMLASIVIGFVFIVLKNADENDNKGNYVFLLPFAFLLPYILAFIFPKLKKLGIGTSNFLPNLIEYLKKGKLN